MPFYLLSKCVEVMNDRPVKTKKIDAVYSIHALICSHC